jgi:hypothetical protein
VRHGGGGRDNIVDGVDINRNIDWRDHDVAQYVGHDHNVFHNFAIAQHDFHNHIELFLV